MLIAKIVGEMTRSQQLGPDVRDVLEDTCPGGRGAERSQQGCRPAAGSSVRPSWGRAGPEGTPVHGSTGPRQQPPQARLASAGEGGTEEAEAGLLELGLSLCGPCGPSHVDRWSKSEEQAFLPRTFVKPGFPKSFQYCQIHRDLTALLGLFVTTEAALSVCTCHTSVFAWPACLPCPFVRC